MPDIGGSSSCGGELIGKCGSVGKSGVMRGCI